MYIVYRITLHLQDGWRFTDDCIIVTLDSGDIGVNWKEFMEDEVDAKLDNVFEKVTPDMDSSIFFTSGTTGFPKGMFYVKQG